MKNKTLKKEIRHPRAAAEDLIRTDMIQSSVINLLLRRYRRKDTEDYSAYVDAENKMVVVTQFYGVPIREEFPVLAIMQDLLEEAKQTLSPNSKLFLPNKEDKSAF